jgi:hypothetical protein
MGGVQNNSHPQPPGRNDFLRKLIHRVTINLKKQVRGRASFGSFGTLNESSYN